MTDLVFFGSSDYSLIILQKLLTLSDFQIKLVVTKTDKPVGRSQTITPNPVARFAAKNQLPLLQIDQFVSAVKSTIDHLNPAIGLCVAFGPPFFDQGMIDIFPLGIINIHPSPLPRYRGATPGPWQIINGETASAVTFFQIDLLPDHGPIIAQLPFDISPTETSPSFYQKAFTLAADSLGSILKSYILNPKSLTLQDHSRKTYYPKLTKETAKIDFTWPVEKISRFVRALLPWPVAWTNVRSQSGEILKMKIFSFDTQPARGKPAEPIDVQIEGKNKTTWDQIKNYYQIAT